MYFLGSSYAEYINRLTHLTASIYPLFSYMSTVFTPFFYFQQIHQNPAELFVPLSKTAGSAAINILHFQYPILPPVRFLLHSSAAETIRAGGRSGSISVAYYKGKWRSAKRHIDHPVIERFVENMRKHLCYGFVVFDSLKTLPFSKKGSNFSKFTCENDVLPLQWRQN